MMMMMMMIDDLLVLTCLLVVSRLVGADIIYSMFCVFIFYLCSKICEVLFVLSDINSLSNNVM